MSHVHELPERHRWAKRQPSPRALSPFAGLRAPLVQSAGPCPQPHPRSPLFDYQPGYGLSPQIRGLSAVHILGTGELSRSCPQRPLSKDHQTSSRACGLVDEGSPQTVDDEMIHRLCTELSTGRPQPGGSCPQRSAASPHACPLFGNATRLLTGSSERRHTKVPGWAVGKVGKAGDGAGENLPLPVHGVCRTFCSPQIRPVVHRLHPQDPWTKFLL
jgi:hypothetical protein